MVCVNDASQRNLRHKQSCRYFSQQHGQRHVHWFFYSVGCHVRWWRRLWGQTLRWRTCHVAVSDWLTGSQSEGRNVHSVSRNRVILGRNCWLSCVNLSLWWINFECASPDRWQKCLLTTGIHFTECSGEWELFTVDVIIYCNDGKRRVSHVFHA